MPTGDWKYVNARPAVDRVLDKCVENERGCWLYQGASAGKGRHRYGRITVGSRRDGTRGTRGTHQVVYEALIGPIPEGLELDHYVCRTTLCCNPWHLEPVTHKVNCERIVIDDEAELERRRQWAATMREIRALKRSA